MRSSGRPNPVLTCRCGGEQCGRAAASRTDRLTAPWPPRWDSDQSPGRPGGLRKRPAAARPTTVSAGADQEGANGAQTDLAEPFRGSGSRLPQPGLKKGGAGIAGPSVSDRGRIAQYQSEPPSRTSVKGADRATQARAGSLRGVRAGAFSLRAIFFPFGAFGDQPVPALAPLRRASAEWPSVIEGHGRGRSVRIASTADKPVFQQGWMALGEPPVLSRIWPTRMTSGF